LKSNIMVKKRDGHIEGWVNAKLDKAISKAIQSTDETIHAHKVMTIADNVRKDMAKLNRTVDVDEIHKRVAIEMSKMGYPASAQAYTSYTSTHKANVLERKINTLLEDMNEDVTKENGNKNTELLSTKRDYIAGEVNRYMTEKYLIPDNIMQMHKKGLIHIHDTDFLYERGRANCCLVNLKDMFANGTRINGVRIDTPHTFSTACTIASQIALGVSASQYGGQTFSIAHIAKYVEATRDYYRELFNGKLFDDKEQAIRTMVLDDIKRGVQTLQYQVITLASANGQAPFITFYMDLGEAESPEHKADCALVFKEILEQRMRGVKNEEGQWINPAFPKLIYALDEENMDGGVYFWLTELSAKCSASRLVPDYISKKVQRELKQGQTYPCMGCRSFLTPEPDIKNDDGTWKFYGRTNQGVCTVNLPYVALLAKESCDEHNDLFSCFTDILSSVLESCKEVLLIRHNQLLGTKASVAPILWMDGGLARLKEDDVIDPYLFGGYSTISLGYAGLWEAVYALSGKKLTDKDGYAIGEAIMKHLKETCDKWREETNIAFSLYGTPIEQTTYKFAKALQSRFGIISGVSDRRYITNSYHVHVTEKISAFDKLAIEAGLQKLSPGGAISYVETADMRNNPEAVLSVIRYGYDNIMYFELNTKDDQCTSCGFHGELSIFDEGGKIYWYCPNCGCTDQSKLDARRRLCGYIGSQRVNDGRLQEIKERVIHLG